MNRSKYIMGQDNKRARALVVVRAISRELDFLEQSSRNPYNHPSLNKMKVVVGLSFLLDSVFEDTSIGVNPCKEINI
jgi:hypothetical protein